jgi:sugar phosphate isomerase/epimerase
LRRSQLTLCFITDEVSPRLDAGLAFAEAEGLSTIDLRTIDGRNAVDLSDAELADAGRRIRDAGLTVSCLCTPLLKWSPPGKAARTKGDQFAFDLGDRTPSAVFTRTIEVAQRLGARHLRIFSYLAYDGFTPGDLRPALDELLTLAEATDIVLHVENENVCNLVSFPGLEALVTSYRHPRLRALPDIANAVRGGHPPSSTDLARLLPYTDMLHFKDFSRAKGRFVGLGEGDVPFADLLASTLPRHDAPLTLSIETHAPSEPEATTRRSVQGLRRLLASLPLD